MKECSKCKQKKELSEFSSWVDKRTAKTLIAPKCKSCAAEYSRIRYAKKGDILRLQMNERYAQNREVAIQKSKDYYEVHKDEILEGRRKHYDVNKADVLIKIYQWRADNPEKVRIMQQNWADKNREKVRASSNKYARANTGKAAERWRTMRLMVMEAYGGAICACCGETTYQFLTIDHIDEDGAAHRKAIGQHLYRWLIANDYPPGFQVLCMNCNWGKHQNGGICPHKDLEGSTISPEGRTAQAIGAGSAWRPATE